ICNSNNCPTPGCKSCQGISRRQFMHRSSLVGASLALGTSLSPWNSSLADELRETVDIASLRPKPLVRVFGAIVRPTPPYWLGWPGTSYDVEGHLRDYQDAFSKAAEKVGVQLALEPSPLESDDAVLAFVHKLQEEKPDAVLVSLQHMWAWGWVDRICQAGIPSIIFAPVGTCFTGHVAEISRRPGIHLISSLEVRAVEQALRMVRAKRQFEESRLLVLAGDQRNESVLERLGTKVRYIPRDALRTRFDQMPETDEVRRIARQIKRSAKRIVEPNRQDILNAARTFVTAKQLVRDEMSNAITTDCLGMVGSKVVPTPPCISVTLFHDAGVTYGCEADVFGAISLMFTSYLFDKPGFMNDPVPETFKNVLVAAHCACGTRLNGFDEKPEPLILRTHSESDLGVSAQVVWRIGQPVTLVRFEGPHQLILDTGTVVGNVNTPPAGGCRTSFEIAMDKVEDARDVLGFHQVVFYGDHRRDVEAYCQMYGIKVVNSPERSQERRTL
ncbi:MAG TPA: hypothetical protein PKH07_15600, partial [bacterium]|nr:hypothetical protein [bacterium]